MFVKFLLRGFGFGLGIRLAGLVFRHPFLVIASVLIVLYWLDLNKGGF
jgi:hypothetical protein